MTPKYQCPNCNQFELGFTPYQIGLGGSWDHQGNLKEVEAPPHLIRCGAFDCGYTGNSEEFKVSGLIGG